MIARIFKPDCHVHFMVILDGFQGDGKSMLLEIIGDEWYCAPDAKYGTREFELECKGSSIAECADMMNFEGCVRKCQEGEFD